MLGPSTCASFAACLPASTCKAASACCCPCCQQQSAPPPRFSRLAVTWHRGAGEASFGALAQGFSQIVMCKSVPCSQPAGYSFATYGLARCGLNVNAALGTVYSVNFTVFDRSVPPQKASTARTITIVNPCATGALGLGAFPVQKTVCVQLEPPKLNQQPVLRSAQTCCLALRPCHIQQPNSF